MVKSSNQGTLEGFPKWQMFVICLIRFSEPIAFTSLFPYVYFMIRDFGIVKDESKISAYTGYLSASFALFQFLFCVSWSRLSDRIGRKPVLLFGLFGTAVLMVIFGFLSNFYVALIARSCAGGLNGNIAVLRTMIGELVTERKHQPLAFSSLPLLWNVGSVLGPLIGGSSYFTRPKTDIKSIELNSKFDDLYNYYDNFLDKFPYALSNIFVAGFLVISMIMGFLFLEETHSKQRKVRDIGLEMGDWIRARLGYKVPVRYWQRKNRGIAPSSLTEATPLLITPAIVEEDPFKLDQDEETTTSVDNDGDTSPFDSEESVGLISRRMSLALRSYSAGSNLRPVLSTTTTSGFSIVTQDGNPIQSKFDRETFTTPVLKTLFANFMLSFQIVIYSEFLPVLLAGEFAGDKLKFPFQMSGGFGWNSDSIGTLLASTGVIGVMVVILLFPYVEKNFKTIHTYRFSSTIFPIGYLILPMLIFTLNSYNQDIPPWASTTIIYLLCGIIQLASSCSFPQMMMLVHRASIPQHRALINGTNLSSTSLARFAGPIMWGWLISFFDSYNVGELSWWLLSLITLFIALQAFDLQEYNEDLPEED